MVSGYTYVEASKDLDNAEAQMAIPAVRRLLNYFASSHAFVAPVDSILSIGRINRTLLTPNPLPFPFPPDFPPHKVTADPKRQHAPPHPSTTLLPNLKH